MKYTWSVNLYDRDGDVTDECVLIHLNDAIIKFNNIDELKDFAESIIKNIPEMRESN